METYDSLTSEHKAILADYVNNLRAWCGEQARANNHADASETAYRSFVSVLLDSLDGTEIIPNDSGLSGAQSLTKDEIITLISHQQNILSGFNLSTFRQAWAKATGSSNLIG